MLFYRLGLMTSTSLTTNTTKLRGSGYLDMMRYSYVGFCPTSVKLNSVSNSKAILLLIHSRNLNKNSEKTIIQSGMQTGFMVLAGSRNNFTVNCTW